MDLRVYIPLENIEKLQKVGFELFYPPHSPYPRLVQRANKWQKQKPVSGNPCDTIKPKKMYDLAIKAKDHAKQLEKNKKKEGKTLYNQTGFKDFSRLLGDTSASRDNDPFESPPKVSNVSHSYAEDSVDNAELSNTTIHSPVLLSDSEM